MIEYQCQSLISEGLISQLIQVSQSLPHGAFNDRQGVDKELFEVASKTMLLPGKE